MFKLLSVVFLLLNMHTSYAFDELKYAVSTKQLVKSKLWYEGLDETPVKSATYQQEKPVILPEEILIPLDQLEARDS